MLKIDTLSSNGGFVIVLSGSIRREHVSELERLLDAPSAADRPITLDLHDVSLVDRDGLHFLARAVAGRVCLHACPAYLRAWLDSESRQITGRHGRS